MDPATLCASAPTRPSAARTQGIELPADATAPGAARRFVAPLARRWSIEAHRADIDLIVSELVSNAVEHGSGSPRLALTLEDGWITIEVCDAGLGHPIEQEPDSERAGGRGLRVVSALASWGCHHDTGMLVVWARMPVPPAPEEPRDDAQTEAMHKAEMDAVDAELHRVSQDARRSEAARVDFLARTSHELRTPLNSIMGFARLLEMTPRQDPEVAESVSYILSAGRHMLNLIDGILDMTSIDSGDLRLAAESVRVADLIDDAVHLVGPLAQVRDVTIRVGCEDLPPAAVDRTRALQVLLNLLSNAIKYNNEGGSIHIGGTTAPDGQVQISVTDNGPGISEDGVDRLFVPFERLDASGTQIEGTGLGLVLAKALTEAMGGRIEVASELGSGSTFSVSFPRFTDRP